MGASVLSTGESLTIKEAKTADAGQYVLSVTDGAATVTDTFTITTFHRRPAISPIEDVSSQAGGEIVISPEICASDNLNYQWFKNHVALPGQTGPSLSIPTLGPADFGTYWLIVSNQSAPAQSDTSNPY